MESKQEFGKDRRVLERGGAAPSSASVRAPWLSADTKTRIKEGLINLTQLAVIELGVSLIGYAVILASGYFFKLAIAAALAPLYSFLSAAALGVLVVCPILSHLFEMIIQKLTTFDVDDFDEWQMLGYLALSPVAGALLLNFALGWNLALVPMIVAPLVGIALCFALHFANEKYKDYKRNSQRSETVAHVSMNQANALNRHGQFASSRTNATSDNGSYRRATTDWLTEDTTLGYSR